VRQTVEANDPDVAVPRIVELVKYARRPRRPEAERRIAMHTGHFGMNI
jgi:hypothetical protein